MIYLRFALALMRLAVKTAYIKRQTTPCVIEKQNILDDLGDFY